MVKNRQRSLLLALLLILSSGFVNSTLAEVAELKSSPESAAESEKNVDNGDSEKGLEKVEDGDGFDTVTVDMTVIESPPDEEKPFQFSGFTKEELAYSHAWEDPDFSKIRTTVNLTLDLKLPATWQAKINWNGFYDYAYSWAGRDKFTAETLKSAESESEMRDLYLDGYPVPWLNLRIGRQIIAWGQSESMQVTDMANPRDMRELGLVDIEDARLPVVATKLSLLLSSWQINFVAIHEIRANKMAGAGSEFDALSVMRSAFIIEDEEVPDSEISNTEYLIRVFKTFNGGDMGLVLADVYDDAFYLELTRIQLTGSQPQLSMTPRHNRIRSIGLSGNIVSGSWLFKAEGALKSEVALMRNSSDIQFQLQQALPGMRAAAITSGNSVVSEQDIPFEVWSEKSVQQLLLGFEYNGFDDLTISLEAGGEKIVDYNQNLQTREITGQAALMATYKALNDTLDFQLVWFHFTDNNGEVVRVNISYDLIDALTVSGGFVAYEAADEAAAVYAFRDNDRVFTAVKYSF